MSDRRKEPCFWMWDNKCGVCGHAGPVIYTPDLLKGPVDCECRSSQNAIRVRGNAVCANKWGIACNEEGLQKIRDLIALADRQDKLWEEVSVNRKILGYK